MADIIDNTSTIHQRDPVFAITYINEKWDVVDALPHGTDGLRELARKQLNENLLAARRTVYPLPLGPFTHDDYLEPPSLYEGDIFAIARVADGGAITVTWCDGCWQHTNVPPEKLMNSAHLSEKQLADAGII